MCMDMCVCNMYITCMYIFNVCMRMCVYVVICDMYVHIFNVFMYVYFRDIFMFFFPNNYSSLVEFLHT